MQKTCLYAATAAAMLLTAFAGASDAFAQGKKLTYEQAWAKCKAEIAKNVSPNESRDTAARFAAGGACMKRYGYKLKKGTMM